MTHLRLPVLLALALVGCRTTRDVAPLPMPEAVKEFSPTGVDTSVARRALILAEQSFVESERQDDAAAYLEEGRLLAELADSLLPDVDRAEETTEVSEAARERSIRFFNAGARALDGYVAESDTARAAAFLDEARDRLEESLRENPFDSEAHYWLGRVYDLRARRLGEPEAYAKAVESLSRLAAMNRDDHRIAALLAQAYDRWVDGGGRDSTGMAGALWQRAAEIATDDAELSTTAYAVVDSAVVFDYHVRSSRALARADRSMAARLALDRAARWARTAEDREFLGEERRWILWDGGNLATRKRFDELLALARTDPSAAAGGMEALLPALRRLQARDEVRHRLALIRYETGSDETAVEALRALWKEMTRRNPVDHDDIARLERVREDYGTVAYNIAQDRRKSGEARQALAFLLQSEETGFAGAPRAALDVAQMLRNNVDAALEAAHRAEIGIARLEPVERRELYRYLVELYRRRGERVEAMRYLRKLRSLDSQAESGPE